MQGAVEEKAIKFWALHEQIEKVHNNVVLKFWKENELKIAVKKSATAEAEYEAEKTRVKDETEKRVDIKKKRKMLSKKFQHAKSAEDALRDEVFNLEKKIVSKNNKARKAAKKFGKYHRGDEVVITQLGAIRSAAYIDRFGSHDIYWILGDSVRSGIMLKRFAKTANFFKLQLTAGAGVNA